MIVLSDIAQGSEEWHRARLGVATASEFDRILTPVELKRSTQAVSYRYRLLAEWLTGKPLESYTNRIIERGAELEAEAREVYRFLTDNEVTEVGFIYQDDRRLIGCSPDGVIGSGTIEKGVEIKCPDAHTHVGYLLGGKLPREYIMQVQGSMFVTGAKTWDWISYHPEMNPILLTVKRDERIIDALRIALEDFIGTMLRERALLIGTTTKEALAASLELLNERTAITS